MIGRLLVVGFFVAYVVGQSPHLVHHLFEDDEVQADCTFLAAADRHHAIPADGALLSSAPVGVSTVLPATEASAISHDPGSAGARAPPSIA
jgi:hypothetical protein